MPAEANSVNDEIKNEAKKVWQNKKGLDRIKYFVYYYKVHFLVVVGVIALISYMVHWYVNIKENAFQVFVINGQYYELFDYQAILDGFEPDIQYDKEKEEISIDGSFQIDVEATDQYTLTNTQRIFLTVSSQDLDVVLCDESFMKLFRIQDGSADLSKVLPADMVEKYADQLVWYDFPIEDMGEDFYDEFYAGRNEACCIDISGFTKIVNTEMFKDKKAYAIIAANTKHMDSAIKFLEYLDE